MEEFVIEVCEMLIGKVRVRAEDEESALNIVRKMYEQEKIVLSADDFVSVDFSNVK